MKNKERYDFDKVTVEYNAFKQRYEIIYGNILVTIGKEHTLDELTKFMRWLEDE